VHRDISGHGIPNNEILERKMIRKVIDMLYNIFRLSAYTLQDKIENYLDKGLRYINKFDSPRYIKSEESYCEETRDMYVENKIDKVEDKALERNRYGFPKR
jgi:delta-aminolevulinic acid dehydratase/porphobilinogen synthase